MSPERIIPVYIGGPSHGTPLPANPRFLRALMHVWLAPDDAGDGPDFIDYLRRSYRVGTVCAHAWVVRGVTDNEAAELMWRWLLDHAGVPEPVQ